MQLSLSKKSNNFKFDQIYKKITNIYTINRFSIKVYYMINLVIFIL